MDEDFKSQFIKLPRIIRKAAFALLGLLILVSACATRFEVRSPHEPEKSVVDAMQYEVDKKATASALQAPRQPTTSALRAFEQGQSELQAHRYQQAAAWLERAIEFDGTHANSYLWLGRTYGYQAQHAASGEQFFLARKVKKCREKAVELDPELVDARVALMSFYLQAPSLVGGSIERAKLQAAEIAKRDPEQGKLAWQQWQNTEQQEDSFFGRSSRGR